MCVCSYKKSNKCHFANNCESLWKLSIPERNITISEPQRKRPKIKSSKSWTNHKANENAEHSLGQSLFAGIERWSKCGIADRGEKNRFPTRPTLKPTRTHKISAINIKSIQAWLCDNEQQRKYHPTKEEKTEIDSRGNFQHPISLVSFPNARGLETTSLPEAKSLRGSANFTYLDFRSARSNDWIPNMECSAIFRFSFYFRVK